MVEIYCVVSLLQETWWALLLLTCLPMVRPFYVPGVAPRDFREDEVVDIKVRLTYRTYYMQIDVSEKHEHYHMVVHWRALLKQTKLKG